MEKQQLEQCVKITEACKSPAAWRNSKCWYDGSMAWKDGQGPPSMLGNWQFSLVQLCRRELCAFKAVLWQCRG